MKIKPAARLLAVAAFLLGVSQGYSQTTVSVDSARNWIGYMNVFDLSNAYQFGSGWGTADLNAYFTGTNFLTLTPNTSIDRDKPADSYWWVGGAGGDPNKIMDASMYVQDDTLAGQTITFSGTCLTNSLVADYSTVAFIKDFAPDYSQNTPVTMALATGQDFSITLPTTAGHHIQYGFETIGPNARLASVASLGQVVLAVNNADPSLPTLASQVLVEGQTANLTAVAKGTAPFSYQWTYASALATNALADGGRISGATTGSLIISNVLASDAGSYFLTVTNSKGTAAALASLVVRPLAQAKTNLLIDPGFESGAFAFSADSGWFNFNGAALQSTNDTYFGSDIPVAVLDGGNCFQTYSGGAGSYNGCYQDRPALPGQIYRAAASFLTPSSDQIAGTGECWLEVQFRGADDGLIYYYRSASIDANSAPDGWISLEPTNQYAADFVTLLGSSSYQVAPPGTAKVRYQITYHADTGGSVYVDSTSLALVAPVVTPSFAGGSIQLAFPTLYGPVYQVLYKNDLADASWQVLTNVPGDGTVKTISDPENHTARFYVVNTQQ